MEKTFEAIMQATSDGNEVSFSSFRSVNGCIMITLRSYEYANKKAQANIFMDEKPSDEYISELIKKLNRAVS